MGQFSWMYADKDNKKQMLDNCPADSYLLVPKEFQAKYGKAIHESCYDGYGHMGGYDIYELVAVWNHDFIPEAIKMMDAGTWMCDYSVFHDREELLDYYQTGEYHGDGEFRYLGILLACYDEDNRRLKYPIKITTKEMDYDEVGPSDSDPNQGWDG